MDSTLYPAGPSGRQLCRFENPNAISDAGSPAPAPSSYRATPQGVFRGDEPVPLYGINWFGLETADRAPHGLWTGRTVANLLAQMRDLGFTALRLPLSPQVLTPGRPTPSGARSAGYPADAYEGLRYVPDEARKAGLYVLLDFHTYSPDRIGSKLPGRPFGDGYSREDWLADLRRMAELSLEFPNVFGIDLCNEPHALTWKEWKGLAREGAGAVLSVNPSLLVIVEGVGNASHAGGWPAFWGENMADRDVEITPELAERIPYLPHVYGPSVYRQPYFDAPDFPSNMPEIWEAHFGWMAGSTLWVSASSAAATRGTTGSGRTPSSITCGRSPSASGSTGPSTPTPGIPVGYS